MRIIDETFEAEFALRRRHPEREEIYDGHKRRSAALRARGTCRLDLRYGNDPRCLLDIFPAGDGAPILFFIHGGYWRALDKSYVSFIAESYQRSGITVVMPSYGLAPDVRIGEIINQIRAAFSWAVGELMPSRIVVAGHSAGGQLAAMLALDQAEKGAGPIVALVGVSGAFDLRPLLRTSINNDLGMSTEEAELASPHLRLLSLAVRAPLVPLIGVVGGDETQGFKRWTRDFINTWRSRGATASFFEIVRRNHFNILDFLVEQDNEVFLSICQFAKGQSKA
jgi:arylformamidase